MSEISRRLQSALQPAAAWAQRMLTLTPDAFEAQQQAQNAVEYTFPEYVELGWIDLALVRWQTSLQAEEN